MPKKWQRGKINTAETWQRGHDDRGNNKQKRRVEFKTPHSNNHMQNRGAVQMAIDSLYDNVSVGETSNHRGRRSPHNSMPYNSRRAMRRKGLSDPTAITPWRVKGGNINRGITWFRVTIPQGNKYPKDFILKSLADMLSPNQFFPLMYTAYDKEAVFYLDSESDANKVLDCNNKIVATDGFRFRIIVRPGYPDLDPTDINDELKNKIKVALNTRFFEATNAIDLSSFHRDAAFASEHFCALFRPLIMSTVLTIIAQHIPNVMALNLNDNKLVDIRSLKMLKDKFPNLKILYLGENRIKELNQLDIIRELKLQELFLQGNPVCNRFKSRQSEYVSEVQKRFPGLVRLDGQEVKKPISFDLEEDTKILLPSRMIFFVNEESKNIAMNFLMEYFRVYDSGSRQNLINAYHEHASMSLTVSFQSQPQELRKYLQENRNLLRVTDSHRRHKLLKIGRLQVVSLIDGLPKTQHIEQSFTMDVCLASKEMIMVVVTGVFKELGGKDESLRYFNRAIVIVPEGAGFCICNEQLHVTQATGEEERKYRAILKMSQSGVASTSSVPPPSAAPVVAPVVVPVVAPVVAPSNEDMQRMALALSQQTNMNLDWSVKCLEQCVWNFDNALAAFHSCFKSGQIPAEAFNK